MENLDKVAEILYQAYCEKYRGMPCEPEGLEEGYTNLSKLLENREGKSALDKFDYLHLQMTEMCEKRAILYILELICPEEF